MAVSKPELPYDFTFVRIPVSEAEPLETRHHSRGCGIGPRKQRHGLHKDPVDVLPILPCEGVLGLWAVRRQLRQALLAQQMRYIGTAQ